MDSNGNVTTARERLQLFYNDWLAHLRQLFDDLTRLISGEDKDKDGGDPDHRRRDLIDRTLAQYRRFVEDRNSIVGDDAFVVFSACSSLERAYLWIAGFKPTLILRLAEAGLGPEGLTAEQARRMERIKAETGQAERELTGVLAAVQESVAAPPTFELLKRSGRGTIDGQASEMDVAVEGLREALSRVLERADALRGTTVQRVLEVLNPDQAVRFLAAAVDFQLRIHRWGVQRDTQRAP